MIDKRATEHSHELIPPIRPISLLVTILLFAVPAAIFSLSLLVVLPSLIRQGYSQFLVFNLAFVSPLALLLIAAFVGLKLEGRPLTWPVIRDRFRLGRMPRHGWWWVLGLCVFDTLSGLLALAARKSIPGDIRIFTWPRELADLMAGIQNIGSKEFLGVPLHGQWWVLFYFMGFLIVFNIFGEELWWRGYILPRQELAQGRWTWVAHGVLWALFHIFYHQTVLGFLSFLPITLSVAFVAQRLKNTWPGIIAHTVTNALVPTAMLVVGITSSS